MHDWDLNAAWQWEHVGTCGRDGERRRGMLAGDGASAKVKGCYGLGLAAMTCRWRWRSNFLMLCSRPSLTPSTRVLALSWAAG
jgi:hypothetical protein